MAGEEMPAARTTDPTVHGTPAAPGVGSANVLIGDLPAWRTMIDTHVCPVPPPTPHGPETCYMGSTTVLINDQMACRMADILQGLGAPNQIAMGSPTVVIGDLGFGMARAEPKAAFVVAGFELLVSWESLTSEERLAKIQEALNATLPRNMPPVKVRLNLFLPPNEFGQFSYRNWAVDLNPTILSGTMNEENMGKLLNTAYHEGRHAEQWWNVAQYRAAQGDTAGKIKTITGLPDKVAIAALSNQAQSGTSEGAMGEAVHSSVYGSRQAYRQQVLSNLKSPDNYEKYRALPEEEDAWRHGNHSEEEFRVLLYSRRKRRRL